MLGKIEFRTKVTECKQIKSCVGKEIFKQKYARSETGFNETLTIKKEHLFCNAFLNYRQLFLLTGERQNAVQPEKYTVRTLYILNIT